MAFSSAPSSSSTPHWSMMNFANRPTSNNSNHNNNVSSDAVANSVDSLSVAVESSTCTASSLDEGHVLPSTLRRILSQVAHCGVCSSLSWATNATNTLTVGTTSLSTRYRQRKSTKRNAPVPSPVSATTRSVSSIDNNNPSDLEHFSSDGENTLSSNSSSISKSSSARMVWYNSLREAMAHALLLVLEKAYKKTGYTLSPIERKKLIKEKDENLSYSAFCERKDKLMGMLLGENFKMAIAKFTSNRNHSNTSNNKNMKRSMSQGSSSNENEFGEKPPFTLQRVAEVLYSPEHYYTQTHKLCNALEKLLLVTSSSSAFGGSSGGEVRQRLDEEREKALLAGERGRENEERRTKRRLSYQITSNVDSNPLLLTSTTESSSNTATSNKSQNKYLIRGNSEIQGEIPAQNNVSFTSSINRYPSAISHDPVSTDHSDEDKEYFDSNESEEKIDRLLSQNVEAQNGFNYLLRKNMRMNLYQLHNFTNGFVKRDETNQHEADTVITGNVHREKTQDENFSKESSKIPIDVTTTDPPPPESIILNTDSKNRHSTMSSASPKIQDNYSSLLRDYSIVTPLNGTNSIPNLPQKPALSSIQNESVALQSTLSALGENIEDAIQSVGSNNSCASSNSKAKTTSESIVDGIGFGVTSMSPGSAQLASLQQSGSVKLEFEMASINHSCTSVGGGLDLDAGRSSTSTSDSESCDDVDDYASDRSDGSDSGCIEPFTAARVMTLNRMQQQQRREQMLNKAIATGTGSFNSSTYDFRPPPDSEYQSSDSIDSMMAEDSGGSDSSLSDLAD